MQSNNGLKILRNKRKLTIRDVEKASWRIAEAKGDKRFRISNGWLAQLEHGLTIPNPWMTFSLCATYRVPFAEILRLCGVDVDDAAEYQHIANPNLTELLPETNSPDNHPGLTLIGTLSNSTTSLIAEVPTSKNKLRDDMHVRYGYIGLNDDTMYPLIRPGSIVEIDTRQRKVPTTSRHLTSQFEKPIFFVELRDGFAFGWCTMQSRKLVITPHPSSRTLQRNFAYPRDVEIVGRVVGFTTRCVDSLDETSK